MGGGELTMVAPGEKVVLRFKATKAGVFVYHCAPGGPMVPWHVVHGMNGAIMVLPRDGLKDNNGRPIEYSKAYFIGEQDYYIPKDENGKFKRFKTPIESYVDDLKAMKTLQPSHVVFNGKVGALTGAKALKADVGDTVLLIHAQANRQSYPHLIGGHGDFVWERGNFSDPPKTNLESWVIGAGSAGASIYTFKQPGFYAYLSHNLIEAFLLGAAAHIVVDGAWDSDLMTQVSEPSAID
jgi:nitrite reductase (NO-forming)